MFLNLLVDVLQLSIQFMPLVIGAYITIAILRFPDLTIDASWSLGGIIACLLASVTTPIYIALPAAALTGLLCGGLTSVFFAYGGRVKLLAGLSAYLTLEAVGARLLGDKASVQLDHKTGLEVGKFSTWIIYLILDGLLFAGLVWWQRSRLGIKARLVGLKPQSGTFLRFGIVGTFISGLLISNTIVGLGGGLWSLYFGNASNLQGIGMVITAFFSLLIGEQFIRCLGKCLPWISARYRRETPFLCLIGCLIFVLLHQGGGYLFTFVAKSYPTLGIKSTDRNFVISAAIFLVLLLRKRDAGEREEVSSW